MHALDTLDIVRIASYTVLAPMWVGASFFWFNNDRKLSGIFGMTYAVTTMLQLTALASGQQLSIFGPLEVPYTIAGLLLPFVFTAFFWEHHRNLIRIQKGWLDETTAEGT